MPRAEQRGGATWQESQCQSSFYYSEDFLLSLQDEMARVQADISQRCQESQTSTCTSTSFSSGSSSGRSTSSLSSSSSTASSAIRLASTNSGRGTHIVSSNMKGNGGSSGSGGDGGSGSASAGASHGARRPKAGSNKDLFSSLKFAFGTELSSRHQAAAAAPHNKTSKSQNLKDSISSSAKPAPSKSVEPPAGPSESPQARPGTPQAVNSTAPKPREAEALPLRKRDFLKGTLRGISILRPHFSSSSKVAPDPTSHVEPSAAAATPTSSQGNQHQQAPEASAASATPTLAVEAPRGRDGVAPERAVGRFLQMEPRKGVAFMPLPVMMPPTGGTLGSLAGEGAVPPQQQSLATAEATGGQGAQVLPLFLPPWGGSPQIQVSPEAPHSAPMWPVTAAAAPGAVPFQHQAAPHGASFASHGAPLALSSGIGGAHATAVQWEQVSAPTGLATAAPKQDMQAGAAGGVHMAHVPAVEAKAGKAEKAEKADKAERAAPGQVVGGIVWSLVADVAEQTSVPAQPSSAQGEQGRVPEVEAIEAWACVFNRLQGGEETPEGAKGHANGASARADCEAAEAFLEEERILRGANEEGGRGCPSESEGEYEDERESESEDEYNEDWDLYDDGALDICFLPTVFEDEWEEEEESMDEGAEEGTGDQEEECMNEDLDPKETEDQEGTGDYEGHAESQEEEEVEEEDLFKDARDVLDDDARMTSASVKSAHGHGLQAEQEDWEALVGRLWQQLESSGPFRATSRPQVEHAGQATAWVADFGTS